MRTMKTMLAGLTVLAVGMAAVATAALTGKSGYEVIAQLDETDAQVVMNEPVAGFSDNSTRPCLAVSSNGEVYTRALSIDDTPDRYHWHEVLAFTPTDTGPTDVRRLFGVRAWDTAIRGIAIIPATTYEGGGNTVLIKDRLLLLVDGYDEDVDTSWRELWMVDPATASDPIAPAVLYHRDDEPWARAGGEMKFTVSPDGTVFWMIETLSGAPEGRIDALDWSDTEDAYVLRSNPVTSAGTMTGTLTVDSLGNLYACERTESASENISDRIVLIDPSTTDSWTTHATFSRKLGTRRGRSIGLAVDSNDEVFLITPVTDKGTTYNAVFPCPSGANVGPGDRIAETPNADATLRQGQIAAGPAGTLYVIQDDAATSFDTIMEITPDSGGGSGGGGGGGGGGNGGGKGKNK